MLNTSLTYSFGGTHEQHSSPPRGGSHPRRRDRHHRGDPGSGLGRRTGRRRPGSCSGHSNWKLKAKADDGRLEVEAEVDSNVNGQVWDWKIKDNGMLAAKGSSRTTAPSGSFEVHRRIANQAGTDKITFKATNPGTGERCKGTVRF
ncbi:MAG: hypothetical protein ACR2JU_01860 [Nocardioidaceae bacterium]